MRPQAADGMANSEDPNKTTTDFFFLYFHLLAFVSQNIIYSAMFQSLFFLTLLQGKRQPVKAL